MSIILKPGMLVKLDLSNYRRKSSYNSYSSRKYGTKVRAVFPNEIGLVIRGEIPDDPQNYGCALILFGDTLELIYNGALRELPVNSMGFSLEDEASQKVAL